MNGITHRRGVRRRRPIHSTTSKAFGTAISLLFLLLLIHNYYTVEKDQRFGLFFMSPSSSLSSPRMVSSFGNVGELLPTVLINTDLQRAYLPGHFMQEDPIQIAATTTEWLKVSQPHHSHVSSPPPPEDLACSCWNVSSTCCSRVVFPNHKWGSAITFKLFGATESPYSMKNDIVWNGDAQIYNKLFPYPPEELREPTRLDYRHVLVVRNIYESLVSGYLYHKEGKECHLSQQGNPWKETMVHHRKFDGAHIPTHFAHPPAANRSLCQYLVDETEEMGLKVYTNYMLHLCYSTTINMFKAVQLYEDPLHRRTLFVCYEDLANLQTKGATVQRILNWLYPGGQHATAVPEGAFQKERPYAGGHASDPEPTQRARLKDLIRKIDIDIYDGALNTIHEMLGKCGDKT